MAYPKSKLYFFNSKRLLGSVWVHPHCAVPWKLFPGRGLTSFVVIPSWIILLHCLLFSVWKLFHVILSACLIVKQRLKIWSLMSKSQTLRCWISIRNSLCCSSVSYPCLIAHHQENLFHSETLMWICMASAYIWALQMGVGNKAYASISNGAFRHCSNMHCCTTWGSEYGSHKVEDLNRYV